MAQQDPQQSNSPTKIFLEKIGLWLAIPIALFAIYKACIDDSCQDRLLKGQEQIKNGIECRKNLLKEGKASKMELINCYNQEKTGLEMLASIKNQKAIPCCSERVRKDAIKQMILFYESSMTPDIFLNQIKELKQELNNFK
jgi:hypothetical protein